jgi:ATP-binding cassette subfamily C protein
MIFSQLNTILTFDHKIRLFFLFVTMILITILEFLSLGSLPLVLKIIVSPAAELTYYDIDFKKILNTLPGATATENILYLMILIFSIKFITYLIYIKHEVNLTRDLKTFFSIKFYNLYLNLNYSYLLNINTATLIRNTITESDSSVQYIISILNLIKEILLVTVVFSLLIFYEPFISLISIILVLLFTLAFYSITNNYIKFLAEKKIILFTKLIKIVNETFSLIKELIVFKKKIFFYKNFTINRTVLDQQTSEREFVVRLPKIVFEYIAILITAIIMFYFYYQKNIESWLPFISLFVIALIRLTPSFNQISTLLINFRTNKASFEIFRRQFDITKNLKVLNKNYIKYNFKNKNKNEIIFKNIFFDYSKKKNNYLKEDLKTVTLKNISFKIKKGEFLGIIGKSGSGKSTLVSLILGLLNPIKGKIIINNKSSKVGYVPQDTYLLDDTIKTNITLGHYDNEVNIDDLNSAIKDCELEDLIKQNIRGINTIVGDKGMKLSGGEKQRIGLARTLYENKDIIILDEATSALDSQTENKIMRAILYIHKKKKKTIIMIAHRLSSLKNCNRVILLDGGEIKAIDTLKNLLKKFPSYKNLDLIK